MEHLLTQKGLANDVYVESCALHPSFLGSPPDRRIQEVAFENGVTLNDHAKLFEAAHFDQFDAIFGVTEDVVEAIRAMAETKEHLSKIYLVTHFSKKHPEQDIADPYYSGARGFEVVWEQVVDACEGIYENLLENQLFN